MGMQVLYIRHIVVGKKWAYIQEFFFLPYRSLWLWQQYMCQKHLPVTQGFRTNDMSVWMIQFNLLKNWSKFALFQTSSILFNSFHLICQMLAKFSGFNSKGPYLSLKKLKRNFLCCAHLLRTAGAWNRKFHVAVVQRWLRNVQIKMRDARASLLFC